jgi:nitroimidazol reductase NimA-like FMN-containing flavoprotein (pyridoxamine 5'-phosphate oxidase superfamily)
LAASIDLDDFLGGRYIASLATLNPDGSSHLAAIWYVYEEGVFYFPTSQRSRKAKNVALSARASVMVDSRASESIRGVAAAGAASVISGSEALGLNRLIHLRYLTEEGLRTSRVGRAVSEGDDVTIRLEPERWHTWDLSRDFRDEHISPEVMLPVDV